SGEDGGLLGRSEGGATFEVLAEARPVRGQAELPVTVEVQGREEQGQAT
nr:hypothetical protein [Rubrobacteraceae bacterium]